MILKVILAVIGWFMGVVIVGIWADVTGRPKMPHLGNYLGLAIAWLGWIVAARLQKKKPE